VDEPIHPLWPCVHISSDPVRRRCCFWLLQAFLLRICVSSLCSRRASVEIVLLAIDVPACGESFATEKILHWSFG